MIFSKNKTVDFNFKEPTKSHLVHHLIETDELKPYCIICPGGGYNHLASHEGETIAQWINSLGMHAGVFYYQVNPVDKTQLFADIESIFLNLDNLIDNNIVLKDKISAIGFSAGGHVASLMGTLTKRRPNLLLLCYPVISFLDPYTHIGSRSNFLKNDIDEDTCIKYSNELNVDGLTPPTFIWHTADDASVAVENSINFALSLSKNNIPFDLHIFESGKHGLGLSMENVNCKQWNNLAINWLKKHNFL